jgi:hypothetical protein
MSEAGRKHTFEVFDAPDGLARVGIMGETIRGADLEHIVVHILLTVALNCCDANDFIDNVARRVNAALTKEMEKCKEARHE